MICKECNIELNKRDYVLVIEQTHTYELCNDCGEE
jgi:hypothetical protein